jgi:predicted anti-sigma-YlaC factor YlaD|eukprot:COSAG02_NODE_103_length_36570_cov_25.164487_16_plen_110_part_00
MRCVIAVIILLVDLSGDKANLYEARDDVILRHCGNCDNCMQASGRVVQDSTQETSKLIDIAVEALSEAVDTNPKLAEREHARAVRRRRRDQARARRQQLASVVAVARRS